MTFPEFRLNVPGLNEVTPQTSHFIWCHFNVVRQNVLCEVVPLYPSVFERIYTQLIGQMKNDGVHSNKQ